MPSERFFRDVFGRISSSDALVRDVYYFLESAMKVQAKQYGFEAVIRQSSDKRYQLTIMVNHSIAGEYPAPMLMVNKYSSFDDAHHQLYRLLGLIAQEHKHG